MMLLLGTFAWGLAYSLTTNDSMEMANSKYSFSPRYNSIAFGTLDNSCGVLTNESFNDKAVFDAYIYGLYGYGSDYRTPFRFPGHPSLARHWDAVEGSYYNLSSITNASQRDFFEKLQARAQASQTRLGEDVFSLDRWFQKGVGNYSLYPEDSFRRGIWTLDISTPAAENISRVVLARVAPLASPPQAYSRLDLNFRFVLVPPVLTHCDPPGEFEAILETAEAWAAAINASLPKAAIGLHLAFAGTSDDDLERLVVPDDFGVLSTPPCTYF